MSMNNQEETQPVPITNQPGKEGKENQIENTTPVLIDRKSNLDNTMPVHTEPLPLNEPGQAPEEEKPIVLQDGAESPPKKPGKTRSGKRPRRFLWVLVGILLVIIVGGVGSWRGYQTGLAMRLEQEHSQIAMAAVTQFQIGLEDENAGRFEMARKRYEYVIRLDPNFPGAQERLTAVMLHQAETAVPTEIPTPTPIPVTPTPDMRGIEEKYNNALALLNNREWDNAISMAELIRKEDINYRAADIDGIFYIALRYRGIQKIQFGNLEPGIYDLTLSGRFAPLDNEAEGYRNWARYYLTGSSFWEIDWASVVQIFGEIYPHLPNLRDGSGWTAQERFRVGSIKYGDELAQEGKYCEARYQYQQALALAADERLIPTATAIQLLCEPPKPTKTPPPPETPTPTLDPEATSEPVPTSETAPTSEAGPTSGPEPTQE